MGTCPTQASNWVLEVLDKIEREDQGVEDHKLMSVTHPGWKDMLVRTVVKQVGSSGSRSGAVVQVGVTGSVTRGEGKREKVNSLAGTDESVSNRPIESCCCCQDDDRLEAVDAVVLAVVVDGKVGESEVRSLCSSSSGSTTLTLNPEDSVDVVGRRGQGEHCLIFSYEKKGFLFV